MPSESGWKRLEEIAGAGNVSFGAEAVRHSGWEGAMPRACFAPESREHLCEVMRLAHAEGWRVAPEGSGTKRRMGGIPENIDLVVSLRRLNRITDYQPADLTVSVEAGLRIEEFDRVLRANGQMLPLDVPFVHSHAAPGGNMDGATVGGVMATHSSGPRRLAHGTVRDFAIGAHFITAGGKLAKSGGKVVKNVAGYDITKLLIGSFGTLGIITDVNFRVFPLAPASLTLVLGFPTVPQALRARSRILNSPLAPQALDLLDAAAGGLTQESAFAASRFSLALAAAGPEAVVERIRRELPLLIRQDGLESISESRGQPEQQLWRTIEELTPTVLRRSPHAAVVKASVTLSQIGAVIESAQKMGAESGLEVAALARAGTGIVYCYLWPRHNIDAEAHERTAAACESLLAETARLGGWAVVEWCPREAKRRISLWTPLGSDFQMMRRLKAQLDPRGILNPGRLYGKI